MTIFCATTNRGKLNEFCLAAERSGIPGLVVETLRGLQFIPPAPETGETFRENAFQKALYYGAHAHAYLFVDDSGLSVDVLGGAPGVHSARYAGPSATDEDNNRLLLERMHGVANRRARFVCAAGLTLAGRYLETFEGVVEGELLEAPRGGNGFGYDPLFYYPPFGCTLAEAAPERKILVSHRGQALDKMFAYLREAIA